MMFVLDFFDPNKECAEHLKQLKENYLKEHNTISKGCKSCELRKLRDKYLKLILSKKENVE